MDRLSRVFDSASERLARKGPTASLVKSHSHTHTLRQLDEPGRLQMRVQRLIRNPLVAKGLRDKGVLDELRDRPISQLGPEATSELERQIGGADYIPTWFLTQGAKVRRTVGMVRAITPRRSYAGTGFLVGPRLLLTNHHVLDWDDIGAETLGEIAPRSMVDFDFEEMPDGTTTAPVQFKLAPDLLLLFSPWHQLDFVLVAVEPRSTGNGTVKIEEFGFNWLTAEQGKITNGEPVFIIQHPNNGPKKIVFQNNQLIEIDAAYLTYEADTDNGSSGSAVYNRQWEIVGLHHATQIARNQNGQILTKSGGLWNPAMGSGAVRYLDLNEGIRISEIVKELTRRHAAISREGNQALRAEERCSPDGLALLGTMLRFGQNAPPAAIAGGALQPPTAAPAPARSFPRPD